MTSRFFTAMLAAALASVVTVPSAAEQTIEKPARIISTMVKTAAIVESVNKQTRELKIIDAQGNRFSVVAGDEVKNFDQIQPRDRIVTEYIESVAIIVAPAGAEALEGYFGATSVAAPGEKPAFIDVETSVLVATVQAINVADRLATLLTEDGEVRSVKLSADVPLDLVQVGDQVQFRVTRAIAISVVGPT